MASSNLTWDAAALDGYLASPTKFLPGATMAAGVPNVADRADIIAYLQTLESH